MAEYKLYIPKLGDYEKFQRTVKKHVVKSIKEEREFLEEFQSKTIEERVRGINTKYSTRLSNKEIEEIVDFISKPDTEFDNRISDGVDYRILEELAKAATARDRFNLSFASKYCHHCRPNKFPVFDVLNMNVMKIFCGFKPIGTRYELKDYVNYVECYDMFCYQFIENYEKRKKQNKDDSFYIDKYIQAIGGAKDLRELLF